MDLVLQRWSQQACLIRGRRYREAVPPESTPAKVMLGRFADIEYCADDGGDSKLRYLPGLSPIDPDVDAPVPNVEYVAGTLELSASIETGHNAFKKLEPYPDDLLRTLEKGLVAFEEMFEDDVEALASDDEGTWYLVAGSAREVHLFYGVMLKPSSAETLPEGALQTMRGISTTGKPLPRVVVGARLASVDDVERIAPVDDQLLHAKRYDTVTRVIRNFWTNATPGFVVVPTAEPNDRTIYTEPEAS